MAKRREAYLVQWIDPIGIGDEPTIRTRIMVTSDVEKIFKKYSAIKRSDVNVLNFKGWGRTYVEIV